MSVKVRVKRGKLYLDIYQQGKRTWEALHLALTPDKARNKEIMRLAEICRSFGLFHLNPPNYLGNTYLV